MEVSISWNEGVSSRAELGPIANKRTTRRTT